MYQDFHSDEDQAEIVFRNILMKFRIHEEDNMHVLKS